MTDADDPVDETADIRASDALDPKRSFLHQLPLVAGLVVTWMMLWGAISWLNLITGILLALVVSYALYLPGVALSGRFNPWFALVFLGRFAAELVVASFQVAMLAFRPRGIRRNAVIAVRLDTRSDLIMTLTATATALIPGSVVVEVDRLSSTLYLHALGVDDEAAVDGARAHVLELERRLVRAVGSTDDIRRVTS